MSATSLYVDAGTPIHGLTGRAKLALAVGLSIAATVLSDPVAMLSLFAVSFAVLLYTGGLRNLMRVWYIFAALAIVGFVVWPAFVAPSGPIVVDVGPVALTAGELRVAVTRSTRVVTYLVIGLGFVTTTSNEEIVAALRAIGLPYAFCFALGTALRLFPTFLDAAGTVRQAQESRGHEVSGGNPVRRLRSFVPLLIPVFMTAFRNVGTQSMALEARGFDPRRERTFYDRQPFQAGDWIAVGVAALVAVGSIGLVAVGIGTQ